MKQKCTYSIAAACTAALFLFAGTASGQSVANQASAKAESTGQQQVYKVDSSIGPLRIIVEEVGPVDPANVEVLERTSLDRDVAAINEGGIAGVGECDGICGGLGDECGCDIQCHAFADCCAGVCDDCPGLPGCFNPFSDVMYSELTGFSGFVFLHGESIFAEDVTMTGADDVGLFAFTFVNLASMANPDTSPVTHLSARVHVWESNDPPLVAPVIGNEIVPPIEFEFTPDEPLAINTLFTIVVVPDEPETVLFSSPQKIWAGVRYTTDTVFETTGVMANLGQGLFLPPNTVGSTRVSTIWLEGTGVAAFGDPRNIGMQIQRADVFRPCCTGDGGPACPADIDPPGGNGTVNVFDLLALLGQWGACADCGNCPADIDPPGGNCNVNVFDLLALLGQWGACPVAGSSGCQILRASECEAEEGDAIGVSGTTCDWPDICSIDPGDPATFSGACCFGDGSCAILTEGDCLSGDGIWQGAFVGCEAAACASPVDCPVGAINEPENCGDDTNGGCFMDVPGFTDIECGDEICGTFWTDVDPMDPDTVIRDTDWYRIDIFDEPLVVEWCVEAEFPVLVGVVNFNALNEGTDCPPDVGDLTFLVANTGPANEEVCVQASLDFGTWYLWVSPGVFGGLPCNSVVGNNYVASLECSGSCRDACGLAVGPDCDQQTGIGCCFCDAGCIAAGDCCLDTCDFCPFAECPDPLSCGETGSCGGEAPGGCFCDEACCDFGDCCADKFDACGGCDPTPLACGDPEAGDCCSPNGSESCDDVDCCEAVCACDPFCCDVGWDASCATGGFDDDCLCGPGMCGAWNTPQCNCEAPACSTCATCPVGGVQELELCGDSNNGGCSTDPPGGFQFVQHGDVICGTAWADGGTRDTDWYRVTVGASGTVTATLQADGSQVVFIIDAVDFDTCNAPVVIGDIGYSLNCSAGVATADGLTPGQEVVVFTAVGAENGAALFSGFTCDNCDSGAWEYTLEISTP